MSKRLLIFLTLVVFYSRLLFLENSGIADTQDGYWLAKLAQGLSEGKYEISQLFWASVQPLYPVIVALVDIFVKETLFSGKIVSLVMGTLSIPVIYLIWSEIHSKEAGIVVSILASANQVLWYYSVHVYRETVFLFFSTLTLLYLYKTRKNYKNLTLMVFFLGLAILSRGSGYILGLVCLFSLILWNSRDSDFGNFDIVDKKRINFISIFLLASLTLPWELLKYLKTGEIIPTHIINVPVSYGNPGVEWFYSIIGASTPLIFTLFLIGALVSLRKYVYFFPLFLYPLLLSIPHMWFGLAYPRYSLPLIPIILGFMYISVLYILNKFRLHQFRLYVMVFIFLVVLVQSYGSMSESYAQEEGFVVVKDAMNWFNENSPPDSKIVVGDDNVYEYYTDKEVIPYMTVFSLTNPISRDLGVNNAFASILVSEDIHYVLVDDPVTPWIFNSNSSPIGLEDWNFTVEYTPIKFSKKLSLFTVGDFYSVGSDKTNLRVEIIPLKRFEKNNQTVEIAYISWQEVQEDE